MTSSNLLFNNNTLDTERLLETFLEMVCIDSPSGDETAFRNYLISRFKVRELSFFTDLNGNLIVDLPAFACTHERRLVLSGHMDVVPPCLGIKPIIEQKEIDGKQDMIIHSDNTTVLGADDKSGLAPILEAVFYAIDHKLPRPALRLIFTVEEETGLAGAKGLEKRFLSDVDFAITLDHTGRQGVIINEAPTYIQFVIECQGRSAHAGMQPEKGVSALLLASHIITRMNLGRLDADTTANIGSIHGGKADNVIPDSVTLSGELRSHNQKRIETEIAWIERVLAEESASLPGSSARLLTTTSFKGYSISEKHPGIVCVFEAARQTGLKPVCIRTNGGSDNNIFVERGLLGVVLSAGYVDPHALTEHVSLNEMALCAQFLLNILEQFSH
jgi:tripeptide aminopeptidase